MRISGRSFPRLTAGLLVAMTMCAQAWAGGRDEEIRYLSDPQVAAMILHDGAAVARVMDPEGALPKARSGSKSGGLFIESQRDAYLAVAAGVASSGPGRNRLLDAGLKALEWGFAQAGPAGDFAQQNNGEAFNFRGVHNKAFFLEAAARSIILIKESDAPAAFKQRAAALVPALLASARWMAGSADLADFLNDTVYTNQRLVVAAALQQAGALGNDGRLKAKAHAIVADVLARRVTGGAVFTEKGGYDANYQVVSLAYLSRYASAEDDAAWRARVVDRVDAGAQRFLKSVDSQGRIDTRLNTRVIACGPVLPGSMTPARDALPLSLYYVAVVTRTKDTLRPVARRIQAAGVNYAHKEHCQE